jgi:hypothetical protein
MQTQAKFKLLPLVPKWFVGRAALIACGLAGVLLLFPARGSQITPLADVVPLDQLEIRTDDVIRLATSLADAVRELKTAEISVKTLQSLQPSAAITGLEMQIAQINVQTSHQKVTILRAIAEAQLATAKAKLEFLRRIGGAQNGEVQITDAPTNPQIAQADATVRILQMILEIK